MDCSWMVPVGGFVEQKANFGRFAHSAGSFGVVYKAVEKKTGELVAIKHIDLEGSDDTIQEIQQEITLLSTCTSKYVTQYKASFVKGVKLWIVMEYLGGGSCLDLVRYDHLQLT